MFYQASKRCYKIKSCCRRAGRKADKGNELEHPNLYQEVMAYEK